MRWVDVIHDLVDVYNNSRHRSIGMAPADVEKKDENRLWVLMFGKGDTYFKPQNLQKVMVGPAATRQFLIRATCQTGPKKTLYHK